MELKAGNSSGLRCMRMGAANCARRIPATPPARHRRAFSTSSWRRMRQPDAPKAERRLISRRRRNGTGKQQAENVRSDDHQDQGNRAHENFERGTNIADERVMEIQRAH